jgi:Leucine-rich repeat (LRR) protein
MRIKWIAVIIFSLLSGWLHVLENVAFAQQEDEEKIESYKEEVRQMVAFLQYSMNVLGNPSYSAKEKDIVINESYNKIFANEEVQIEDDLDEDRDVVTNKDVQAYLKDVDFFFKNVEFDFNIIDIDQGTTPEGQLFFTAKLMRSLKGVTVANDSMNNDQERYVEINVDEENKDLKIASIYTTKLSRDDELAYWWNNLSREWKTVLGVDVIVKEGLRLSDIDEFSDSTYVVAGEQFTDTIRIIDYIKEVADRTELDLSNSTIIDNLKPVDQLKSLKHLDISGSVIIDIFPIRNITTLQYLDCSNTFVKDLEPLRYSKSLRELHINNTPVTSIRVVENFENLEVLHLQQTVIDSLPSISALLNLQELNCGSTNLESLDSLKYLSNLRSLDCSNTAISEIAPLAELSSLEKLVLDHTDVNSLVALESLENLQELSIKVTKVDDLKGLENLDQLQVVYADDSGIELDDFIDLIQVNPDVNVVFMSEVLFNFWDNLDQNWQNHLTEKLQLENPVTKESLHEILKIKEMIIDSNPKFVTLDPLHFTPLLEHLSFSNTPISSLGPVRELKMLKSIDGAGSQVIDLQALHDLNQLKVINFENTGVANISALTGLDDVDTLIFNNTIVKDISVLNEMKQFRIAYFDSSRVTDEEFSKLTFDEDRSVVVYKSEKLRAWWGNMADKWQDLFMQQQKFSNRPVTEELHKLAAKRSIEVSSTGLRSLDPIPEFVRLESLNFTETRISSLYPLSGMTQLKVLRCPRNPIGEIEALSSLKALEVLDLNNTRISDIDPVSSLVNLREFTFSGTNVKDLSPLESLTNLEVLDFSKTKVRRIRDLYELPDLKTVTCYNNRISDRRIEEFRLKKPDCEVIFY